MTRDNLYIAGLMLASAMAGLLLGICIGAFV